MPPESSSKRILITGANSGLGYAATLALAKAGHELLMLCRDAERGEAARQALIAASGNPNIRLFLADLSAQQQIHRVADELAAQYRHLDVLVNNAGANFFTYQRSVDGIEMTLAVNYLAPFLLTQRLLPLLQRSPAGRILSVSGEYHRKVTLDPARLETPEADYDPMKVASQMQLAKVFFTYELARRLQGSTVTANCYHPGAVRTPLQRKLPWRWRWFVQPMSFFFLSPARGAETIRYLAVSPEVEGVSGQYFRRTKAVSSSPLSYDADLAAQLWKATEALLQPHR